METPEDAPAVVDDYVEQPETTDTGVPDDTGTDHADNAPEQPGEPEQNGVQKRIDQLTREKYELKGHLDATQRRLAEIESRSIQAPAQTPPEPEQRLEKPARPTLEQFDGDYEAHADALATFTEQMIAFNDQTRREEAAAERTRYEQEANENRRRATLAESWNEKLQRGVQAHTDFDVVARNPDLPVSPVMGEAIQSSDNGEEVLYHLGKNPEQAMRIAGMSEAQQIIEIGRLSGRLEGQSAAPAQGGNKVSAAPTPTTPTRGTGSSPTKDPSKMSFAEYKAFREAGGGQ